MHSDLWGLLYCLMHVEMLLLSGISREDGELEELDAVPETQPRLHTKALVQLLIDAYPRVLEVHFLYNLVQMHSPLTNDEAMEQLVNNSLLTFRVSTPASLRAAFRSSLIAKSFFFCSTFSAFVLPSMGALKSSSSCFLTSNMAPNAFPTFGQSPSALGDAWRWWHWLYILCWSLGQRRASEKLSHRVPWPWFA